MSIIFNDALYTKDSSAGRIMTQQKQTVIAMRNTGHQAHKDMLLATNVARTPAEAYREMDATTKIEQVPAGEFALLSRVMGKVKPINLGRKLYEYRKASDMNKGQSSMTGNIGVKGDKVDYGYGGTVVPIHDKGFEIDHRDHLAMQAEGFDELVDYAREAERGLMQTANDYLWAGDASLVFKTASWLGLKADPTVATATIGVLLAATATPADNIRAEVSRIRDILYITNNCTNPLDLIVSREIASNWERPFTTADGSFGTIGDYILKLRGIKEIYEDSALVGEEISFLYNDQAGFHGVSGMAISTYAMPRLYHNSPFAYVKFCALGFVAKEDFTDRKCALYATTA
jgi:hypothetical protein